MIEKEQCLFAKWETDRIKVLSKAGWGYPRLQLSAEIFVNVEAWLSSLFCWGGVPGENSAASPWEASTSILPYLLKKIRESKPH